jgi:hypothetical protein
MLQSICEVEITVLDDNDNMPVFVRAPYSGTVTEHSLAGTTVLVVSLCQASSKGPGSRGPESTGAWEEGGQGSRCWQKGHLK